MEFGVTFPQTDIEPTAEASQRYASRVEALGFDHLLAYDHVLGVDPPSPSWDGPYDYTDRFLEPLVLFGQQAAVTDHLEFVTGVLVLPQRETPLVAKQAATVDRLSEGRLVLGAGVGWNEREYRNLGQEFGNRGERIEEQLEVLRSLWSEDLVDYEGQFHSLSGAGINPRPIDGTIPLWLGGGADPVLRRIARTADGWVAPSDPIETLERRLGRLENYLEAEGRTLADVHVQARIKLQHYDGDGWLDDVAAYDDLGIDAVGIGTMGLGYATATEHLAALEDAAGTLSAAGWMS
jgi:probable F420-dependent oxidoreductase